MSLNENLRTAKRQKNDEFYTQLPDIENELRHYSRASCENHVRPNFCLRRRGERGQRTGRSICRRRVSATVAREPETRGFMEPACR